MVEFHDEIAGTATDVQDIDTYMLAQDDPIIVDHMEKLRHSVRSGALRGSTGPAGRRMSGAISVERKRARAEHAGVWSHWTSAHDLILPEFLSFAEREKNLLDEARMEFPSPFHHFCEISQSEHNSHYGHVPTEPPHALFGVNTGDGLE